MGKYELAIECYNKATNLDPEFESAHENKKIAIEVLANFEIKKDDTSHRKIDDTRTSSRGVFKALSPFKTCLFY
jgi:lipoprotein NlpI